MAFRCFDIGADHDWNIRLDVGVHGHLRLDATTGRRNAMTVCSRLFCIQTRTEFTMQTSDPMIPGHMTVVTRATMNPEAVVVGVSKSARATLIVAIATTTEDTMVDATTTAVAALTTGGTRAVHTATGPYMVEYRLRFLFPEPVRLPCASVSLPVMLAFLYVFDKSSIELNTIGFWF